MEEIDRFAYADQKSGGTGDDLINATEARDAGTLFYDADGDGHMSRAEDQAKWDVPAAPGPVAHASGIFTLGIGHFEKFRAVIDQLKKPT